MNNKYFISFLTLVLSVSIGGFSCNKDNLKEIPRSFESPENFYKTKAEIEMVFSRSLEIMYDSWSGLYPWSALFYVFGNDDQLRTGHMVIAENTGDFLWRGHYNAIMNLNFVIRGLKNGQVKETEKTNSELMGMAKCLRAWNYFQLVRLFGDIPIMTDETEDYFAALPSKASIKEVYDLIVSDFKEAINSLPSDPRQIAHPNKEIAKALLTKVYITMASYPSKDESRWKDAMDLAWEIIQGGQYSLVADINDVFTETTETGPEMMWSFIANKAVPGLQPQVWSTMNGWGDIGVDREWAERFPEQPRKGAYLDLYDLQGQYYKDRNSYPGIKKFIYNANFVSATNYPNYPVIRYADILLMYAEAANMVNNGPTDNAVWAVNQTVERANDYVDNIAYPNANLGMSKEEFDTFVLEERNWELCFEMGDRWFDLVRKRAFQKYLKESDLRNFSNDDLLFPIPEKDLRLNKNLLPQNPGYPDYQ